MKKREIYRVKKGKLVGKNIELSIDFGLIFVEDGNYSIEVYVPESVNLNAFSERPNANIDNNFTAFFITEEKNELEIHDLYVSQIVFDPCRIDFNCYGSITHRDISPFHEEENPDINKAELIYLELEGMKIEFSDLTSKLEHRLSYGQKSKGTKADHTGAELIVDYTTYSQIFRKSQKNGNIVVEFHGKNSNKLSYNRFLEFRNDYISFLSFLNGAQVKIRKEYAGNFVVLGSGDIDTPIVITYSFRKIRNESYNRYIPLGYRIQNRNPNILNQAMIQCFNKFREWNMKIDLSSIIFYLNGAEKTRSIEEKFFILIIAFERLTTMYAEQSGLVDQHLPLPENFIPIRQEFYDLLQTHKTSFGSNYEKARSIVANLHEVKRISTKDKMFGILNDTKITVDDDLRELINIVRNKVIHKGDVGEGLNGIKHLKLLTELLYEIMCRLIEYKGPKISNALLTTTSAEA